MKKFLFFFLISLSAQTPAPTHVQIKDFSPNVKSISIGPYSLATQRCNFFFNSPAVGQVQVVCYLPNNPIPIKNEIEIFGPGLSISGTQSYGAKFGVITWLMYTGNFFLVGTGTDNIEAKEDGTF